MLKLILECRKLLHDLFAFGLDFGIAGPRCRFVHVVDRSSLLDSVPERLTRSIGTDQGAIDLRLSPAIDLARRHMRRMSCPKCCRGLPLVSQGFASTREQTHTCLRIELHDDGML